MASLRKVADRAGVSIATVSRVINNDDKVKPGTKLKVQRAIKELDYFPNRVAQRLRNVNRQNKLFGVVLPDIQNPFYVDVVRGIEEFAYANDFAVMIGNFGQDVVKEKLYLEILRSEEVDGFIIAPTHKNDENVKKLIKTGYPVVCIDRGVSNMDADVVKVNNREGAYKATEYLIKLGHRRIAHITGDPEIPTTHERIAGYKKALTDYNVEIAQELIVGKHSNHESGVELMDSLLDLEDRPTAVFTANNLLTLGALETIHKRKIKIPDEISIVGFDDMYWSMSLNPPLTAVRQSGFEIGKRAAELLFQKIRDPQRPSVNLILKTELIIRESCTEVTGN